MQQESISQLVPPAPSPKLDAGRWVRFVMSLVVVSAIWLVGLPWLGRLSVVADHIENQQRQGIDPSAMFYSDLENLPPVVHRIERLHQSNPDDFWSW